MNKILIAFMILIISTSLFAETLTCNVQVSLEEVARVEFAINSMEQKKYISSEGYSFYLNSKGDSKFELEIFNGNEPSRSYAEGFLKTPSDTLTWTLWTRDVLLTTQCRLAGKK